MKKEVLGILAASLLVAPAIVSAEPVQSKFNVTLGGYVKLDYAYNSELLGVNGALLPNGGVPKTTSLNGQSEQSILTARQSRLWVKVDGPEAFGAKTSALIEGDFYGDNQAAGESPAFRMRHAYGALDWANTQILFGQYWDIWGPMVANTQDFRCGAATGSPNTPRVPQLKFTQKLPFNTDNALRFVVGMQDPQQSGLGATGAPTLVNANAYSSKPNVAGQIMFDSKSLGVAPGYGGINKAFQAGVFGLMGSEQIQGTTTQNVDTYGYGVYAFVPVLRSADGKSRAMTASFEGQAYMAANMNYNASTGNQTIGAGDTTAPAKGYGFIGQMIFYPTQDLGITGGYGRRNAYNYQNFTTANFEKYNELIYGNVAYDLNAAVRFAVEYEHQKTLYGRAASGAGNLAGASDFGQDNTIRLAAYYFF